MTSNSADLIATPSSEAGGSHLFLLRVWTEQDDQGNTEWCGRVQHVIAGRPQHFHSLPGLIDALNALLPQEK
jgi:hypothetical protein